MPLTARLRDRPATFGRLLMASAKQWSDRRASTMGAALALYMIFSLAPILVLLIAVAGAFFGEDAVRSELVGQLEGVMGERGAEVVQMVLASAHESGSGFTATAISLAVLIFSATTAFAELKESLDALWDVRGSKVSGVKGLVRSRLLSFGLVLVLALFMLASLAVNAALAAAHALYGDLWDYSAFALTARVVSWVFSFSVVTALFAVVFKLLPSTPIPWRDVIPGAVVTAALFHLGNWGIGFYLGHGAVASAYGAAGSVVALLLWVYYSAQIFFFGAVFTRQYAIHLGSKSSAEGTGAGVAQESVSRL